jgi:hypothetical protein
MKTGENRVKIMLRCSKKFSKQYKMGPAHPEASSLAKIPLVRTAAK